MGFLGVTGSRRGREDEVLGGVSVLIRGRDTRAQIYGCSLSLSLSFFLSLFLSHTHTHTLWSWDHTVREAICKPGRGTSPRT